jgi:hypothetical protein
MAVCSDVFLLRLRKWHALYTNRREVASAMAARVLAVFLRLRLAGYKKLKGAA